MVRLECQGDFAEKNIMHKTVLSIMVKPVPDLRVAG